jgi:hypothetical protein
VEFHVTGCMSNVVARFFLHGLQATLPPGRLMGV